MSLKKIFGGGKTSSPIRIIAALVLAGIVFLLFSSTLEKQLSSSASSPGKEAAIEMAFSSSDQAVSITSKGRPAILPRYPVPEPPLLSLAKFFKPVLYIILFLFIYLLFFQEKAPGQEKTHRFLYLTSILVLLIFIFSSSDLLRMVLNYYLNKKQFTQNSYLFELFARGLAKRMASLLIIMPLCAFLNFKIARKGREVKSFFLTLFSLTGFFTLILGWWLLNALFTWGFGVKGIELRSYTFPLAYFSIVFPLTLFYLVQYLKK